VRRVGELDQDGLGKRRTSFAGSLLSVQVATPGNGSARLPASRVTALKTQPLRFPEAYVARSQQPTALAPMAAVS